MDFEQFYNMEEEEMEDGLRFPLPSGLQGPLPDLERDMIFNDFKFQEPPFIDVSLKHAKSKDSTFKTGDFPSSMLCSPYKYHMKIRGNRALKKLSLNIVFADDETKPKTKKPPLSIDDVKQHSPGVVVIKFGLGICSFHYKRREFVLRVSCENRPIWTSTPFRTYARRRPTKAKPKPQPQPQPQQANQPKGDKTVQSRSYVYCLPHPQAYQQNAMRSFSPGHSAQFYVLVPAQFGPDSGMPQPPMPTNFAQYPYPYPYYPFVFPKEEKNNGGGTGRGTGGAPVSEELIM